MCCRYLVESRWFKQWKKYVGFDSWDMFGAGDPNLFPGPVDNAGLFPGPIDNSGLFGGECCGQRGRRSGSAAELPRAAFAFEAGRWRGHAAAPPCTRGDWPGSACPRSAGVSWCPGSTYVGLEKKTCCLMPCSLPSVSLLDPESQSLKEHLIDELDYVLVPTEAWNKLVAWYGCIDGQQPIVRKVSMAESTSPHPGFSF